MLNGYTEFVQFCTKPPVNNLLNRVVREPYQILPRWVAPCHSPVVGGKGLNGTTPNVAAASGKQGRGRFAASGFHGRMNNETGR